jgi:hypothetical protein
VTYYVESCTILSCMLVGLRSFMISLDYWVYMGSSITVWLLSWLLLYLCSYKLDGFVTASIRIRFNIKLVVCVFKTKVFVFQNQFWQLIAIYIYICLNLKFKPRVCQCSYPLCPIKNFRWLRVRLTWGFTFLQFISCNVTPTPR